MKIHDIQQAKVSESVRKLNPELFAASGFRPAIPQPHAIPALDKSYKVEKSGGRRVANLRRQLLRVSFISLRRREITDSDNFKSGFKPLRDAIAREFGIDDNDKTVFWEYGQQRTSGKQETLVRIELL